MSILILGGTGEARALATELHTRRITATSSLAGRVSRPRMPVGEVRQGGFGGIAGLATYLAEHGVDAVVDATHPFAATISANAVAACAHAGVPLLRFARPGWSGLPGSEKWTWVDDHHEAARAAAAPGERVFLSTGRQTLAHFTGPLATNAVLVRVVDPIAEPLPRGWQVLERRGPYLLADERELLRSFRVTTLVTKDSGGDYTRAKLDAAAELGVRVVIVRRPEPAGPTTTTVDTLAHAIAWAAR
ncbi:cobalt-precorrin-6A reductase [Tomitella biformata]|uniref:cobalt-precorrin-6A reductase n=1 Tax=Tomitella biformata TaxID=630403 RepID=UPI0004B335EE|nr:cobalt-precorrin-6A reductase [Tomitella biformata]